MFGFPDWMKWATSNKIEYFGSVVDEKLVDDFKILKIGIQPTEETTDCEGVNQFRERVENYLAGLGFEVVAVGDDEQDADGDDDLVPSEEEADTPDKPASDSGSDSDSPEPPRRSRVSGFRFSFTNGH
jgi:hypothetical protein